MKAGLTGYRIEDGDGHSLVSLLSALNDAPWGEIEKCGNQVVERVKQASEPAFLLDLTQMDSMGSSIVALLIRIWKSIDANNGRMVVINQSQIVEEVLNLAGLNQIWTVVGSREEGLRALGLRTRTSFNPVSCMLTVVGLAALVAAGTGLYLLMNPSDQLASNDALILEFSCSSIAFFTAFALIVRASGAVRTMAAVVLVSSVGIAVTGFVYKFSEIQSRI